jgi:hypothetical protein
VKKVWAISICLSLFCVPAFAESDSQTNKRIKALDRHEAWAQYESGMLYGDINYLMLAATQDHLKANMVMCSYLTDTAFPHLHPTLAQDWDKAVTYCLKAEALFASNEVPSFSNIRLNNVAQYYFALGHIYGEGKGGVAQSKTKAMSYLQKSFAMNHVIASEKLAEVYFLGTWDDQNYKLAHHYAQYALNEGSNKTVIILAEAYEKGLGVNKNDIESQRLYFIAAELGNKQALSWLESHPQLNSELIEKRSIDFKAEPFSNFLIELRDANSDIYHISIGEHINRASSIIYPRLAEYAGVEGYVNIDCRFNDEGQIEDCIAIQEVPKGYDFAQNAIKAISRPIPILPGWQAAVKGRSIRKTIRYVLE